MKISSEDVNNLMTIGEVSRLTKVTKRTLRYYEEFGLIKPYYLFENGYRYYSSETILRITIIKYLKLVGFSLEEIKEKLLYPDHLDLIKSFDDIMSECDKELDELKTRKIIVRDWQKALEEAIVVSSSNINNVNVKYVEEQKLLKFPCLFDYNYKKSILDWKFANYLEDIDNKVSGPVMFYFPDIKERVAVKEKIKSSKILYIQKALKPLGVDNTFKLKAGMYASIYHKGGHGQLIDTYEKLIDWQEHSRYRLSGPVIERFVVDCWTTFKKTDYVTEILAHLESDS